MTDPTIQGPMAPAEDAIGTIMVSLSEIDAMAKKAARGAGFEWGLAEEAGKACRWLAAYRLPGPAALLDVLEAGAAVDTSMCPIRAGAGLSDRGYAVAAGETMDLGHVSRPLLVLPFAARVAAMHAISVVLIADGSVIEIARDGIGGSSLSDLAASESASLRVARAEIEVRDPVPLSPSGYGVDVDIWRRLDGFAQRTYVPASEASRLSGAGAGTSDND